MAHQQLFAVAVQQSQRVVDEEVARSLREQGLAEQGKEHARQMQDVGSQLAAAEDANRALQAQHLTTLACPMPGMPSGEMSADMMPAAIIYLHHLLHAWLLAL